MMAKAGAKILELVKVSQTMYPKMKNLFVNVLHHFTESTVEDGVNDI